MGNVGGNSAALQFDRIKSIVGNQPSVPTQKTPDSKGPSFGDVLKSQTQGVAKPQGMEKALESAALKFSSHAIDRIRSRGIQLGPERMEKLGEAIDKAASKGAKETLVMAGDSAFIVSVKNRTVITAMDANSMKENVFTNIDSTVLI